MAHLPDNQWETITLKKPTKTNSKALTAGSAGAARAVAAGYSIGTEKKHGGGGNARGTSGTGSNLAKLDAETDQLQHAKLGHDFKMAMQKARLAKKMSQADVAKQINEKSTVINDYESGRAVPNPAIIQKLQKVLGCKLPKAQQPKKTKNLDDN